MKKLICILFLAIALQSCYQNYPCANQDGMRLAMISFTYDEIDTIISRKYVKGSNFTTLIDTLQIDNSNATFYKWGDSAHMVNYNSIVLLNSKYDYRLYIPAVNRSIDVTDIHEPQLEGTRRWGGNKDMCANVIETCKVDGVLRSLRDIAPELFIKK